MNPPGVLAIVIFAIAYFFIATEKVNKTIVAVLGATTMIFFGLFEETEKIWATYVDFNTIFLLIGMMTFVGVVEESGLFQYIGVKFARLSGNSLFRLFWLLTFFVALMSAFLDNVTTILVALPLTFAITEPLGVDPVPFVLGSIFASNIGGTMTLIGDPPNIMIGTEAGLNFIQFFTNTAPAAFLVFVASDLVILFLFRNEFKKEVNPEVVESLNSGSPIKNKHDFMVSLVLLVTAIVMFSIQGITHFDNSAIALASGFVAVLLMKGDGVERILKKVDWSTVIFFLGLFVMVGALGDTGVLNSMANSMVSLARGSYRMMEAMIITSSAVMSAIVDNVPLTATLIPVIKSMKTINPSVYGHLDPLWWSLSLGACLGGNGSAVGASANVVALALLKRSYDMKIGFGRFLKYGILVLSIGIAVSIGYVFLRYR